MKVYDGLCSFSPKIFDEAFGPADANVSNVGTSHGENRSSGEGGSGKESLKTFLSNHLKKRYKWQRRLNRDACAKDLRLIVLQVIKEESKLDIDNYCEPGSIPQDKYNQFRPGFKKVIPTFWETIVLETFGNDKVRLVVIFVVFANM